MEKTFETPILFIVFNRPETTKRVFEEIRKLRPAKLFVTADGPRAGKPGEAELCEETRRIATNIDWPCEIKTFFRKENMGLKYGVATGLDWFFDNVEEGIILEDDDLPEQSFFYFCEELLEKYRNDPRIMHISGVNVEQHNKNFVCKESYYFLSIPSIWGWATWRRAWKHYDVEVKSWPEVKAKKLLCNVLEGLVAFRFAQKFQGYYERKINSYDGQWMYACLANRGLCIYPSRNLISNIGYSENATGTKISDPLWDSQSTEPMSFPLMHPQALRVDPKAEAYNFAASYKINRYWSDRMKWWLKSHFTEPYLFFKKLYYRTLAPEKYNRFVKDDERALIC